METCEKECNCWPDEWQPHACPVHNPKQECCGTSAPWHAYGCEKLKEMS